jgi:hypothetical protein
MIVVEPGGVRVTFLSSKEDIHALYMKYKPHFAKFRQFAYCSKSHWYRLASLVAALEDWDFLTKLLFQMRRSEKFPPFEQFSYEVTLDNLNDDHGTAHASSSSVLVSPSNNNVIIQDPNTDWNCLLFLIRHEKLGWKMMKPRLVRKLWDSLMWYNSRQPFFFLFFLLRKYQFPAEISQEMANQWIAQDIFHEWDMNQLWTSEGRAKIPRRCAVRNSIPINIDFDPPSAKNYNRSQYLIDAVLVLLSFNLKVSDITKHLLKIYKTKNNGSFYVSLVKTILSPYPFDLTTWSEPALNLFMELIDKAMEYLESFTLDGDWMIPKALTNHIPNSEVDIKIFLHSSDRDFCQVGGFKDINDATMKAQEYFGNRLQGVTFEVGQTVVKKVYKPFIHAKKVNRPYLTKIKDITKDLQIVRLVKERALLAMQQLCNEPPAKKRKVITEIHPINFTCLRFSLFYLGNFQFQSYSVCVSFAIRYV